MRCSPERRSGRAPPRGGTRAVLLDALGTLIELEPPAARLRAKLLELAGVDVGEEAAARGFAAEIGYYVANHLRGRDERGLEALRDECAAVLHEALQAEGLERPTVRRAMLDALGFRAFPDVRPALLALRERRMRLVVVSNWDCSLPAWLEAAGIGELVDGAVSSAVVGEAKPAPAVFHAALDLAEVAPEEALHVGDSPVSDIEGARAAGVRAVLIARHGRAPEGVETVRSLAELPSLT